jgi:paraquat-inducible protein A
MVAPACQEDALDFPRTKCAHEDGRGHTAVRHDTPGSKRAGALGRAAASAWRGMRILAVVVYCIAAAALASVLVTSARQVSALHRAVAERQSPEQRTELVAKSLLESLTFGLYKGGSEKLDELDALLAQARVQAQRAHWSALALAVLSAVFVLPSLVACLAHRPFGMHRLAGSLLVISLVFLGVGLIAPVFSLTVHKQLPVLGEVVLQHDTRSIVGTVARLADGGNLFTAALLGLFSVLTPVAKLVLEAFAAVAQAPGARGRALSVIHHVGKWSMTDVFVVAVLLAFLAGGHDGLTNASLGPGLYFFAAHGLLSLLAGHLLVRVHERDERTRVAQ